ncbi:hypothetical protein MMPV_002466 [Pyropia vietnamensis]
MAALRRLLQYSDTERKWLLAEDGDVERHLSPAGLRNAAVWRTTETFSAEPFTQGMMDAPDSALGMDLAYLLVPFSCVNGRTMGHVSMATRFCIWFEEPDAPPIEPHRSSPAPVPAAGTTGAATILEPLVESAAPETRALATANPMTVGRFLYDEDAHEMIIRLHFAGNVTIMRYKVLPSTRLRERSVTMCVPPPGDDGSGDVLPQIVSSHLDILDVCHGGRHGHDETKGGLGAEAAAAIPSAAPLDPSSPGAVFFPSTHAVHTSVVDFEGFGESVASRMGGLYQPCLSGVMFGTPFTQDAGGWVADGFASAQSCLRLFAPGTGGRKPTLETRGYHFHPTLPSLPLDAMSALEQSFSRLAFSSTPTQRMPALPLVTAAGEEGEASDGNSSCASAVLGSALLATSTAVNRGRKGYPMATTELLPSPVAEPLLDGGDLLAASSVPGICSPWAAGTGLTSVQNPPDTTSSGWTPDQRELFEALYGAMLPLPTSLSQHTAEASAAARPPPIATANARTQGDVLGSGTREGHLPHPPPTPSRSDATGSVVDVSNDGTDELPNPEQVEGFSRLFTTADSSSWSSS